ncbi:MAG: NAD-dependent epimerase/dehydratase family protein [Acidimicrobiales bacterium]
MQASKDMDVLGLDPAGASLEVASKKRGADCGAWVHGDLGALGALQVDLGTMTGNVAEVFVTNGEWSIILRLATQCCERLATSSLRAAITDAAITRTPADETCASRRAPNGWADRAASGCRTGGLSNGPTLATRQRRSAGLARCPALCAYGLAMRHAVVLAGTGAVGWAAARRLVAADWEVVVTGRNPTHVPPGLATSGARFVQADRHDPQTLPVVLAGGADLVVDCACYTAAHAADLLPFLGDVTSTVMISSKAVYVDEHGRHSNSEDPPQFEAPITEDQPTLRPNGADYNSKEGYGPNKVAAEETLLASGYPVTVLRPSKVHGAWSRQPREWYFVKRALDRRPVVLLARHGAGADHPSAALNIAALIETVADRPGRRILNAADPDCPDGRTIASIIAGHVGHTWQAVLLDGTAPEGLGRHPWDRIPPVILDTANARQLGYMAVGDYSTTVTDGIDWLVDASTRGDLAAIIDQQLPGPSDYADEDDYLRLHRT